MVVRPARSVDPLSRRVFQQAPSLQTFPPDLFTRLRAGRAVRMTFREIDVPLLEGHDLVGTESRVTRQQHDQVDTPTLSLRRLDEPLVVGEVVE